ncbi:YqhA family protein [Archangium lipolyticum]|uniref:YqhA family protein n=1 Tax=Archangium lipolyticum TaxID=2970465 RepID=UPI00214A11B8|nr:YqhA family protein [Archangium lipolyticum]
MRKLERAFEQVLWASRFIMVGGVIFSALMAVGAFYMATLDALSLPGLLRDYTGAVGGEGDRTELRAKILTLIVKSMDGYVITAILLIFSLGLYEFFIGKLEVARESPLAPRLLHMGGLEDLKGRIAKLLVLVLVIEFFQRALQLSFTHALDLLYLALGIVLIGLTLYLGRLKPRGSDEEH